MRTDSDSSFSEWPCGHCPQGDTDKMSNGQYWVTVRFWTYLCGSPNPYISQCAMPPAPARIVVHQACSHPFSALPFSCLSHVWTFPRKQAQAPSLKASVFWMPRPCLAWDGFPWGWQPDVLTSGAVSTTDSCFHFHVSGMWMHFAISDTVLQAICDM